MNRQNFYKEKYHQLKSGWQESQTVYKDIVDSFVNKDSKILDIGCGHGNFMKSVYTKTDFTHGLDPDKRALKRNKIIRNKVYGTAEAIPFPNNFFDLIVSAWTLEHLENPSSEQNPPKRKMLHIHSFDFAQDFLRRRIKEFVDLLTSRQS